MDPMYKLGAAGIGAAAMAPTAVRKALAAATDARTARRALPELSTSVLSWIYSHAGTKERNLLRNLKPRTVPLALGTGALAYYAAHKLQEEEGRK